MPLPPQDLQSCTWVQVPQSLQLLSWGWEHGRGFWGLFFSAEEPGLGSAVAIAGRLHHPGSLMGRGSGGILWGPWRTWQQFLVSEALEAWVGEGPQRCEGGRRRAATYAGSRASETSVEKRPQLTGRPAGPAGARLRP